MSRRQAFRRSIVFVVFLIFPITINYYSPYLIMQSASEGTANASFFLWTAWAVTALFIGRVGCAWICPLGAAQMLADSVAPKPLKRLPWLRVTKYVLAIAWVGGIVAAAASAGGYRRVNLLYATETGISTDSVRGLMMYYFIIMLPLIPVLFLGRHAFCHYFCPFGVLNAVSTWLSHRLHLPSLHLRSDTAACLACHRCQRACPMSLPVTELVQRGDMYHSECILCGTCADTCPEGVVRFAFGQRPAEPPRPTA